MGFLENFQAEDAYLALAKIAGGLSLLNTTGDVYWLDNSNADASDSPGRGAINAPFKTLAYAHSQCTADNDDIIAVKEGHSEAIAAETSITKNRVNILGIGSGAGRPTFTFGTLTSARFTVSGDDVRISNLRLVCAINALAYFILTSGADGIIVDHCDFDISDPATMTPGTAFDGVGEDFILAYNRIRFGNAASNPTNGIALTGAAAHRAQIIGNLIDGDFTGYGVEIDTASGHLMILDNHINNYADVAQNIINLHASCTGFIVRNHGHTGFDDTGGAYTPDLDGVIKNGNCFCCQNFFSNVLGESGGLTPGTVAT